MSVRAVLIVCALVIVVSLLTLTRQLDTRQLDTRERRIVQLEIALAQAHAEADTLATMLERGR